MNIGSNKPTASTGCHEEYTFTDRELQDILGFLEQTNKTNGKVNSGDFPNIPVALGQGSPTSLASQLPMQFQPHPSANRSGDLIGPPDEAPNNVAPSGSFPVKQNHQCSAAAHVNPPVQFYVHGGAAFGNTPGLVQTSSAVPIYPQSIGLKELYTQTQTQHLPPGPVQPSKPAAPEKPQISHSTVEKQRRDRINNLIDELRDLVPPQTSNGIDSEVKRPKHVVLSDTIALLKKLQSQIPQQMQVISQENPVDHDDAMSSDSQGQANLLGFNLRSSRQSSSDANGFPVRESGMSELPMPPKGQNANGVVVEEAGTSWLVKVRCKDRRGLLSDVISSLKSLDLEIRTAAITTTNDGTVHDVFEVTPDEKVSPEEIQCHVHSHVYTRYNSNEKRLRG
eukprot:CAMPEP_0177585514 /NCGR_PEP_ID=MMETSP0419_2-20121207/4537_1 /TAXON_ID=582737 /ORGANISM="Tetraselmis sp., Strain GSL018" /LENGTH=393 /DNA_ID=CAMNT_0019075259 /DNA_START=201 /DNA_END=1383 /DNA_ORIENTATION=+